MNIPRIAVTCALALTASLSFAQSTETSKENTLPENAPAAKDCVKRHDHGAERQVPSSRKGCKPPAKVAKAKTEGKKAEDIQGHDHGKFHKNQ